MRKCRKTSFGQTPPPSALLLSVALLITSFLSSPKSPTPIPCGLWAVLHFSYFQRHSSILTGQGEGCRWFGTFKLLDPVSQPRMRKFSIEFGGIAS
ncbi:hypothetical protein BP00DRAFT_29122 [Aspergillus indologenus CBS 114.80]|uniref:Secreted protein n=1 Tax=Aspergillus indologenus CBS 114.80 TaxID=1450541 RepID=A0A2V5IFJ3_9EURO|nr:hypothetical protein BP00DRAFT_29122 [Aspergillus indologenus CBS 114.80]